MQKSGGIETLVISAYIYSERFFTEGIEMKIRTKVVLAVGVAGLSLAACTPPVLKVGGRYLIGSPSTTTTLVPPKNAPVGFNAARTEFVLPYNLGYLPAPELALAKVDPAYASGLADAGDWMQAQVGLWARGASQRSSPAVTEEPDGRYSSAEAVAAQVFGTTRRGFF